MKISKGELRKALIEVREEELDSILKTCEDKELEQKIEMSRKRMDIDKIHKQAQKQKKQSFGRWPKVAAAMLALALVGATSAYAIEKVRQATVEWDANIGKNEDDFHFQADNPTNTASPKEVKEAPGKIERRYHLSYAPEGFREEGEDLQDEYYLIQYKRKEEIIYFKQMTKTEKTMADLELTDQEAIDIHGYKGQMGNRDGEKILRFATGQYVFWLSTKAAVTWDEMVRMAESISEMAPDSIEVYYEPTYIPKGYEMWEEGYLKESWIYSMCFLKNKKQYITFTQGLLGGTISIDSENAKRKEVEINGWKGQMNYKKNKQTLIWATNEYSFVIAHVGSISEEELLKVARSVSMIE